MRVIGIVLIVIAVVLALGVALASIVLPRSSSSDDASRSVERTTTFGLNPQNVQLDIPLAEHATCQQGPRPLDVVLLIDQSSSMDGEPLAQAVAGAQAFLETLDLTEHQVALGLFADQVAAYNGLTSDRAALDATLAQAEAGSGTNIAAALTAARNELQGTRRRFGSSGFVVLFSDGNDSSGEVQSLAGAIKDAGVRIFVVGPQGGDLNQQMLESIASGPDYVRLFPAANEIPSAFRAIAEEINQVVATDLSITDSLAASLPANPGSATPEGVVTPTQVQWQIPTVSKNALAALGVFSYQVDPTGYGLRRLAPQAGKAFFNDCANQPVSLTLPSGPSVLFLPPLPLALLLPLLFLLSGLALLLLSGRDPKPAPLAPRPVPQPLTGDGQAIQPTAPEGTLFAGWLSKAESLTPEIGRTPNAPVRTSPTLIIGLGATGRVVMHKIAAELQDRWGPTLPDRVRLLQVNVPLGNPQPTDSLPNLKEVSLTRGGERLSTRESYLEWARKVSTRSGRPAGRIALFADLATGKDESQLHPALRKALGGQKGVTVWIVADAFGDDSSSIATDIGHLVRTMSLPDEIGSVRLCLATQNARWPDRLGPQQRSSRTFATLRELQRLRQKRDVPFVYASGYGQRELEAVNPGRMFDEVYLFDGKGEEIEGTIYDISALPADEGVLAVMANGMLAFLDPALSQKFLELEKNAQSEVARTGSTKLENYVSAMGCCVVRVPIEEIRRLAELRLLHRTLLDCEDGLIGWERLERDGTISRRKQALVNVTDRDLSEFLQETGLSFASANPLPAAQVRTRAIKHLERVMNDGEPLRLRWASALLTLVGDQHPDSVAVLEPVKRELAAWIALVGETTQPKPTADQQSSGDSGLDFSFGFDLDLPMLDEDGLGDSGSTGALYADWESRWQRARQNFPTLKSQSPETPVVALSDEGAIFERYLSHPGQESARLRKRAYWLWQDRQGFVTLKLLILPNDLGAKPANEQVKTWANLLQDNPYAYAVSPRDVAGLNDRLLDAARTQSRGINSESVILYLDRQPGSLTQILRQNSSPLFRRNELASGEGVAATPYRYLLAPAGDAGDRLGANLKAVRFTGSDPATVVMMQVKHILPIANTEAFVEAAHAYRPVRTEQVFLAEQLATEMEQAARQEILDDGEPLLLPAEVVALLDQNQALVELLGAACVYGLLDVRFDRGRATVIAASPSLEPLASLGVDRLLVDGVTRLSPDVDGQQRLRDAVNAQRQTYAETRFELLNRMRQELLPPLLALPSGQGQELGIVVAAIIQHESVHTA